ncbi:MULTISPECIES: hypothetical protein [unclassified Streptomyces]|uniref:hypothetical protein n=1 Tax=unclassified Streptomyces TaxID=2593676 RepID=UPI0025526AD2|nr:MULTISPECIES: hypothetical protein [unclassified Streptomyces]WRZ65498.1 hypothetical protein OG408_17140 [Streptomyces sp. NBC_01257]WSU59493.1 hypothetical protein OG450_17315 [Streptomyces sp. NBC_01104]
MLVTRKAVLGVAAAAAMASTMAPGVGGTAAAVGAPVVRSIAPEADVSHHGHVSLWGSGLGIWLRSENRGPSDLAGVTVRLRVSVPLAGRQELPQECLQADRSTVLCRTGELHADGSEQRQLALELQLAGRPTEVVVRVDTVWNGGATDRNSQNSEHEVLAPATGDEYVF